MRSLLTRVPKAAQSMVATLVRSTFAQPDAASTWAQQARVVEQLGEDFAAAAEMLVDDGPDILAFTAFPKEHEPGAPAANRRGGDLPQPAGDHPAGRAVLAEQHDEWAVARRYMSVESLLKARLTTTMRMECPPWQRHHELPHPDRRREDGARRSYST